MPQIFKIGSYWVFFNNNESDPLDDIHVQCDGGNITPENLDHTILACALCHNNSRIRAHPAEHHETIEARSAEVPKIELLLCERYYC